VPSGIIYSVPITLTNSQSSNTPAPFQQMVNITESTYSSYLTYNGNSANFEYYTLSGNTVSVLPAWIESNNSGKLITWVKLPNGIPAKSSITIYLGFASKSNNLLSSSGTTGIGEAPQLPCGSTATSSCSTYAEYDDGASVFNNYWNFAGTSLPNSLTTSSFTSSGCSVSYTGSVSVNNGLTFSAGSNGCQVVYATTEISTPYVFEEYTESTVASSSSSDAGMGVDSATNFNSGTNFWLSRIQATGTDWGYWVDGGSTGTSDAMSLNTFYILGLTSGGTVYANTAEDAPLYSASSTSAFPSPAYLLISDIDISATQVVQWARVRAYPPNGTMPTAAFGVIQGGSPSVTVSPSSVSLLSGMGFTLTADASGGTSPYTYQWYNATSGTGIPIAGATSSTYTATAGSTAGTFDYYVKVTDSESKTAQSSNSVVTVSLPPSGITYYVPITLTNSQSSNTPSPFQQMVNISESEYPNYLTYNSNFANFEYISPSGTVLTAWIESSNSGKIITWVKLPNGIPAKSSITIYLGFASTSSNLLSSSGTTGIGEAPQLPCGSIATSSCSTYAEYDDGASVFNYYTNFAGTSLPTGWVASGTSYTTDNGIVLFSNNVGVVSINYGSFNIVSTNVFDAYGYSTTTGSGINNPISAGLVDGSTASSSLGIGTPASGSNYVGYTYTSSVGVPTTNLGVSASTQMHIFTLYQTHSTADWQIDYGVLFSSTVGYVAATSSPLNLYSTEPASGQAFVQWIRVRAYPPNGTMPSVSFG
ncbi:hypothetical protein M1614_02570, partial [Candidatus Marsarchaeota archaeon]|nr:hypothetical protein [Candidatus Marsarchaeota archaeon]